MEQEKINFSVARDFTELFNAATKFFNQNFKHFFHSMLFIIGPLILITAISMAAYQYSMLTAPLSSMMGGYTNSFFNNLGWGFAGYIICSLITNLVLITTVYSYMIIYSTNGPKNFTVAEVRKMMFKNIGKVVKGFFVMLFLVIAIGTLVGVVAGFFITVMRIVATIIVVLLVLLFLPPLMWRLSSFYLIQIKENRSAMKALDRTGEVMRGKFFSTWLYMMVTGVAIGILFIVLYMPQTICQLFIRMGQVHGPTMVLSIGVMMVSQFFVIMLHCIFYFMCGLRYYSLSEKLDGASLNDRIDEIGKAPSLDVEQYY